MILKLHDKKVVVFMRTSEWCRYPYARLDKRDYLWLGIKGYNHSVPRRMFGSLILPLTYDGFLDSAQMIIPSWTDIIFAPTTRDAEMVYTFMYC